MSIDEFAKIDTTFNEGEFLTKVNNVFIKLFSGIMFDELEDAKHFVSDDIYNKALSIVEENKKNGSIQMYDELNVKNSQITNIEVKDDVYRIDIYLQSRYMDYIMNLEDSSLISGDNTRRIQVDYKLTFTKKANAKTMGAVRRCPSCGAAINVNNSGKCEYCGTIFNLKDYDWVLTKLESLN